MPAVQVFTAQAAIKYIASFEPGVSSAMHLLGQLPQLWVVGWCLVGRNISQSF